MIGSWSAPPSSEPTRRVEPAAQPVIGDPHGGAQRAEARRGRVEQLARRVEGAGERAPQGGQRVEPPAEVAQQRPALLGERVVARRAAASRVSAIPRNCCGVETAAADGAPDPRVDVVRGPDADARPLLEQRPRLVRLVERSGATMTGSDDGSRASASRRDGSNDVFSASRARTAGNSSSAIDRVSIGQRRRRDSDGLPATRSRHGTEAQGSPA